MTITVSAPGSLMLLGEHAVLHHELAIVCAIAQRIRVSLTPISSKIITIRSSLGEHQTFIDKIVPKAPFTFVLTAISALHQQLKTGFTLEINSEFSDKIGFASSAAVTVATLGALQRWLTGQQADPLELFKLAKSVINKVQGRGSGADAAACIFGGTIAYQMAPLKISKLPHNPLLSAVYSGSKTPTAEVIALVNAAAAKQPQKFAELFKQIGQCSVQAATAIHSGDSTALAKAMQRNQTLMTEMGVNNTNLQLIIDTLQTDKQVLAAKISGSGLGDCVVALLNSENFQYPFSTKQSKLGIQALPITISPEGICYE